MSILYKLQQNVLYWVFPWQWHLLVAKNVCIWSKMFEEPLWMRWCKWSAIMTGINQTKHSASNTITFTWQFHTCTTRLTFSLIMRALLQRGSASLYRPRLLNSTERLFSVAATWICTSNNTTVCITGQWDRKTTECTCTSLFAMHVRKQNYLKDSNTFLIEVTNTKWLKFATVSFPVFATVIVTH